MSANDDLVVRCLVSSNLDIRVYTDQSEDGQFLLLRTSQTQSSQQSSRQQADESVRDSAAE